MNFKEIFAFMATAIGSAAAAIAILGYRGPTSFPIIRGIDIPVCIPPPEDLTPSLEAQKSFLDDLEKHKRQPVFIANLTVYAYGNCKANDNPTEASRKALKNFDFDFISDELKLVRGEIRGGALTVGFPRVANGDPGVWLTIGAPGDNSFLADISCGENCFGAHGLYKVSFSSSEGYTVYKLDPFPVTSGVIDAYQCTLAQLEADNAWKRFVACRF